MIALIPELPDATFALEIAFGADLSADEGTWTWVDVTEDLHYPSGMTSSLGRNDEASVSASATISFTLINSSGNYSRGGQSIYWPGVRRNTPVRIVINTDILVDQIAFQGYAVGFSPDWIDSNGRLPITIVEASGVLRRLAQGSDPLRSAQYRFHTIGWPAASVAAGGDITLTEYWPLEEDKSSIEGVSTLGGGPAIFIPTEDAGEYYGKVGWGADEDNAASARSVEISDGGTLLCPVRSEYIFSDCYTVSFSLRYGRTNGAFVRIRTDDDATNLVLYTVFYSSGTVEVNGVTGGSSPGSFVAMSFNNGDPYEWDNVWHHYSITYFESGGSVFASIWRGGVLMDTYTATPGFRGRPRSIEFGTFIDPDNRDPIGIGHVAVWDGFDTLWPQSTSPAAYAHSGENPGERITRLCDEQGISVDIVGATVGTMGPQRPLSVITLLREAETVDLGILYDGVSSGLTYIARSERENAAIDATFQGEQLVSPFKPTDDDQRTVNRATVTSRTGSKYTAEDTDGPLGSSVVGVYDSSIEVNTDVPGDAPAYADWQVHLGTYDGYRYPQITLNMRSTPEVVNSALILTPSSRVALLGLTNIIAGLFEDETSLLVEGVSWSYRPHEWSITFKCSPYDVWNVGTIAAESGDVGLDSLRLRPDASTVSSNAIVGSTTLTVTTGGPLWTTRTDDFPLNLDVGGIQVVATACSGATATQTFTINPLTINRDIGTPVDVWNPPGIGL